MNFSLDVRKAIEGMKGDTEKFVRHVNTALFTSIIQDTPVDTGRAQGNWQATENTPFTGQTGRKGSGGSISRADSVLSKGIGLFYLSNNLPYIVPLEYGYSGKAPSGMVRRNVARIRQLISEAQR